MKGTQGVSGAAGLADDALAAYLFGYPLVLGAVTRRNMLAAGLRGNELFLASGYPRPADRIVVRPAVDLLSCVAWLDLKAGPLVLHLPALQGRYCVVELLDAWSNVFASLGSRTTGEQAGDFLLAGPGFAGEAPPLPRIDAPTDSVLLRGGAAVRGAGDLAAARALLDGFGLAPLAFYRKYGSFAPGSTLPQARLAVRPASVRLAEGLDAESYFTLLSAGMAANPPAPDAEMERRLAALGLTARPFLFSALPSPAARALSAAVAEGPGVIRRAARQAYADASQNGGWLLPLEGVGVYGDWYLQRAAAARFLPGAPIPQDAACAFGASDAQGMPLRGCHAYRLRFLPGAFPPVRASWSLTVYDSEGFLARNPAGRSALGPQLGRLTYGEDGSLDLLIGRCPPPRAGQLNWLPAPRGAFNLLLRLRWPAEEVLSGAWRPLPPERLEPEESASSDRK